MKNDVVGVGPSGRLEITVAISLKNPTAGDSRTGCRAGVTLAGHGSRCRLRAASLRRTDRTAPARHRSPGRDRGRPQPVGRARERCSAADRPQIRGGSTPDHLAGLCRHGVTASPVAYVPNDMDAAVFASPRGGLPRRRNWSRIWSKARHGAGVSDQVHLHDLRHMGAPLAAQSGGTTKDLIARLGHSTSKAALIYQHAIEERDQTIALARDEIGRRAADGGVSRVRAMAAPSNARCLSSGRPIPPPKHGLTCLDVWWRRADSNRRPPACKAGALAS